MLVASFFDHGPLAFKRPRLPLYPLMTYELTCDCGRPLQVTARQAGDSVSCECGGQLEVPKLSQLRLLAGQGAFETNSIDRINRLKQIGELPRGTICLECGRRGDEIGELIVQCEKSYKVEADCKNDMQSLLRIFFGLLVPFDMLMLLLRRQPTHEVDREYGHDRSVIVPLPLCEEHKSQLSSKSQRALRAMLVAVPEYAQLLEEFPRATFHPR